MYRLVPDCFVSIQDSFSYYDLTEFELTYCIW